MKGSVKHSKCGELYAEREGNDQISNKVYEYKYIHVAIHTHALICLKCILLYYKLHEDADLCIAAFDT